jgi:hypothetical protein
MNACIETACSAPDQKSASSLNIAMMYWFAPNLSISHSQHRDALVCSQILRLCWSSSAGTTPQWVCDCCFIHDDQTSHHFLFFDWYRGSRFSTFISPRWTSFLHNSLSIHCIHYASHSLDSATDRIDSVSKAPSHATQYIDRINSNFPAQLRKFSLSVRRGREQGDALLNRYFEDHVLHVMFLLCVSRDLRFK